MKVYIIIGCILLVSCLGLGWTSSSSSTEESSFAHEQQMERVLDKLDEIDSRIDEYHGKKEVE